MCFLSLLELKKKIDKNFVISDTGIIWIESYSFPVLEEGRAKLMFSYSSLGGFKSLPWKL